MKTTDLIKLLFERFCTYGDGEVVIEKAGESNYVLVVCYKDGLRSTVGRINLIDLKR